jgi:uncharacterized protein (DUF1810 family)
MFPEVIDISPEERANGYAFRYYDEEGCYVLYSILGPSLKAGYHCHLSNLDGLRRAIEAILNVEA